MYRTVCSYSFLYSVFNDLSPILSAPLSSKKAGTLRTDFIVYVTGTPPGATWPAGGLKWTRTIDLALIRRAL